MLTKYGNVCDIETACSIRPIEGRAGVACFGVLRACACAACPNATGCLRLFQMSPFFRYSSRTFFSTFNFSYEARYEVRHEAHHEVHFLVCYEVPYERL